ncbi:MAG TPA: hypothetical protein VMU63_00425 [Acidimicrobiales bacterium]|nr:hypothetical protein [Acidimicrobiales bacterium]
MTIPRTPEDRFDHVPGFDFPVGYAEVPSLLAGDGAGRDGTGPGADAERLRVAYIEAGYPAGPAVVLLHGEPSCSFLYRKMIPVLADAGYRVIAPEVVRAAYDAPFPAASYKAAARSFPGLIPQSADNPATPDNQRASISLEQFRRPFLCLFSDRDPITAGGERVLIARIPGAAGQPHDASRGGHFLQEDSGPEIAQRLVDWAGATG